jgi:hypothetical protein
MSRDKDAVGNEDRDLDRAEVQILSVRVQTFEKYETVVVELFELGRMSITLRILDRKSMDSQTRFHDLTFFLLVNGEKVDPENRVGRALPYFKQLFAPGDLAF